MILHYEDRHARQSVRLEGPDLLGKRRREISARAENTTRDSIQDFDSVQFHIASHSRPGEYHVVDLRRPTCDCEDFPRVLFCKHIAGVYLHFPHLNPEGKQSALIHAPESTQQPLPQRFSGGGESLQALSQDVFSLSQSLASRQGDPNPAVIEAFRSAKYSLTTAIASLDGRSALPEKDVIAPNQRSWPETATWGPRNYQDPAAFPMSAGLRSAASVPLRVNENACITTHMQGESARVSVPNGMHSPRLPRLPMPMRLRLPPSPHLPRLPRFPCTCLIPSRSLLTCLPLFFPPLQTGHNSLQNN